MSGSRAISVACLCLAIMPGCQLLHSYRPAPILIRDAETKQPIAGATAHISYPLTPVHLAPQESRVKTAADGIAWLTVAPEGTSGLLLTVRADAYLTEQQTLSVESVRALKPAGWFERVEQRPSQMTIELYAGPRPTVELVLPAGFRGLVKATVKPTASAPPTPQQRSFRCPVAPDGNVNVSGPAVLSKVTAADFQAVFADGIRLVRVGSGPEIGFWSVKSDQHSFTFLAGTRSEYEAMRRSEFQTGGGAVDRTGSGRRGGRHGARGGGSLPN